ncbi:MAG: hypothetical protein M9904_15240 [Chitinophagaceae bacterium]|nr:hypothetical protein [Chitinophagaceae bacterium]
MFSTVEKGYALLIAFSFPFCMVIFQVLEVVTIRDQEEKSFPPAKMRALAVSVRSEELSGPCALLKTVLSSR